MHTSTLDKTEGAIKKDNPENIATQDSQTEEPQNKITAKYMLETTIRKQYETVFFAERKKERKF